MYYLDPNIEHLVRVFDQNQRKDYLRLDLNENPGGLPEEFVSQVLAEVTPQTIAQYPETLPFAQVLAEHLGTDIHHLCVTNGSAEAIRYVIQAFTAPGGRIVGVVPSYFMFQVYSQMYGRSFVPVAYRQDLTIRVEDILAELTPDTQMLILLNPNNPMGNVYSQEEFVRLLDACQQRQITLLALDPDEAALLGVNVERMRYLVLILATLTVASIVSVTGLIAFIGLLAPHIARLLDRRGGSHALALSGVIGAALLLLADCAARTLSSSEIPISILTSFMGAPFLIWLIARRDLAWQ